MSQQKQMLQLIIESQFAHGLEREYRFHPERRWRFDYAWPDEKIAVEYEGIFQGKSRHTGIKGYTSDCKKYNSAQALGWKVFRFTASMVGGEVVDLLEKQLKVKD